jgi:hypothetical protein
MTEVLSIKPVMVMAVDQSPNNTGWAIGSPSDPRPLYGKFDLDPWGDDEPARVEAIFLFLQEKITTHRITHLFYEKEVPAAGLGKAIMSSPKRGRPRPIVINTKDPSITLNQNAVIAMCWLVARLNRIPVKPIDVNDMRARFIGTRHITGLQGVALTKEFKLRAVKACAMRCWLVEDHNVAEALGHLDFALSTLDRKHASSRDVLFGRTEMAIWRGEK